MLKHKGQVFITTSIVYKIVLASFCGIAFLKLTSIKLSTTNLIDVVLDRGGGAIAPLSFLKIVILVLYSPYKIEKDTYISYFAPFSISSNPPTPLIFFIFFEWYSFPLAITGSAS